MTAAPRILPDLTFDDRDFARKLDEVLDPDAMDYLSRRHPDGIRVSDIAEHHRLSWVEALDIVFVAWAAFRLNVRKAANGDILFVWPADTLPPLTSVEKGLLRQARRDLADGPDKIFLEGAATDLGVGIVSIRKALDFLVTAGLLAREGKTFRLTRLALSQGDAE